MCTESMRLHRYDEDEDDNEDDEDDADDDEADLPLECPDSLLQMSHESCSHRESQYGGAEILVERQQQRPDSGGKLGEEEG